MKELFVGVDLGGTKIYTALGDEKGNILNEIIVETEAEKGPEAIVEKIKYTIKHVSEGREEKLRAIGIGSPGPLNIKEGIILNPPNLPFENYNIVEKIEKDFNIPVYLDNDANAATIGEYAFGAGKGTDNMVFITASTGVGGGAVLNGKIYRGSTFNALEVGHTTIEVDGKRCGCGNKGCFEAMTSGTAIKRLAEDAVKSSVKTSLKKYKKVTAKEVFIEANNEDRVSNEILEDSLKYLGVLAANCANILDPDLIVIGGGVSNGGDIVFNKIKREMEKRCLEPVLNHCKIDKAMLGGKAGVIGALALAITEFKN
ncbi:ROK family protein [uncultured Clostridium sp.]|uniref:ROK family protein n=1 Tax=uncultured Clostridium sp. TaxID=59620 RepID=UPI0026323638|nr:ROK family protein [uncultured Clostridium sp.]